MGLFDRLFGKKKEPVPAEQVVEEQLLDQLPEGEDFGDASGQELGLEPFAEQVEPVLGQSSPDEEASEAQLIDQGGLEEDPDAPAYQGFPAQPVSATLESVQGSEDDAVSPADEVVSVSSEQLASGFEDLPLAATDAVDAPAHQEFPAQPVSAALESVQGSEDGAVSLADEVVSVSSVDELVPARPERLARPVDARPAEALAQVSSEPSDVASDLESELSASNQHFTALMADYYAKKAAVQAAAERGEELVLEAQTTKPVEDLLQQELVSPPVEPLESSESTEEKYHRTLKKTRTGFGARLNAFLANFRRVDEAFFEDLEELLILSDVGVTVATKLTEELRYEAKLEKAKKPEDLKRVIIEKMVELYEKDGFANEAINFQEGLTVMLFVGVNGVGKTTSIGKLAHQYKQAGKRVMLVAADTFRAGAVAQLVEWGRRVDVPVVTGPEKSDPASVVFDGMEKAVAEGVDILLIDTAGRLQNKDNLMAELEKIGRIIKRVVPEAPHETLLALDASTGQNALSQAKEFSKITPLTGLVLTKLDGTAKGGVVLAIREELDIPVKFIGFGEKIDDIGAFRSEDFMKGLLDGLV